MYLFKHLSEIGTSRIVSIFSTILTFFNTPVRVLLAPSEIGQGVLKLLELLGFNFSLPLWEFMLVNFGLILIGFMIVRFLSFIRG